MAFTGDAEGIFDSLVLRDEAFDFDEMDPIIAEIIVVDEGGITEIVEVKIPQMNFRGLECPALAVMVRAEFRRPIDQSADDELMEMRVGPGEGGLDDCVKLGQIEVKREQDTSPDRRLDILEGNLDLHDQLFIEVHGDNNAGCRR